MNTAFVILIGLVLQSTPKFEVASVRTNTGTGLTNIQTPPTGRVNIVAATLRQILRASYRLQDYQIVGGSDWLNEDRFDIQARPADDYQRQTTSPCTVLDCPLTATHVMLQALLADRFQLKSHRETRQLPVYELTIARNGLRMKEVPPVPDIATRNPPPPPPPPAPGTPPPSTAAGLPTTPPGTMGMFGVGISGSAVPMTALVSALTQLLGGPVIDKTGLKGAYDFKIVFSRDSLPNAPAPPPGARGATDPAPSVFTALQEELGLRLEATRGPVEVLVIDSVQKPTPN